MTPRQHLDLLLRFGRTFNLRKAIERVVTSGSTVLDAGCGLGLLSMWAAKQGAARVQGIDIDDVAVASRLAEENGCAECCEFRSGDLWTASPPSDDDRVDVLIAMLYLNDPRRDEQQARLACHIRDRWLRPGGKMVPERVEYTVEALAWDAQDYPSMAREETDRVRLIEEQYGLGFNALRDVLEATVPLQAFPHRGPDGTISRQGARAVSERAPFCTIDYRRPDFDYPAKVELSVVRPGVVTSLLWTQSLYFEELLLFRNESVSWISEPAQVCRGDTLRFCPDSNWRQTNRVELEN